MTTATTLAPLTQTEDLFRPSVVWDGGNTIAIPHDMGQPREDQLQGTVAEQLIELAGRGCYDSLGQGRPSCDVRVDAEGKPLDKPKEGYHSHIKTTNHGSVLEHYTWTLLLQGNWDTNLVLCLLNRPGLYVTPVDVTTLRVTINPRVLRDWPHHGVQFPDSLDQDYQRNLQHKLLQASFHLAPHILDAAVVKQADQVKLTAIVVPPKYDHEKWISVYLNGSRGFSHEQVRHKYETAVSQRSTRYVDETDSPWIMHPLEQMWLESLGEHEREASIGARNEVIATAQKHYAYLVGKLQDWLIQRSIDKFTARKQGRGAARGYLGNALETSMIFSASVAEWRWMYSLRAAGPADAEIRQVFCELLPLLQQSRYGDRFQDLVLKDAPDGLGQVAVRVVK